MRGLPSTLVLLVVFLGLAAYIYFVESERPPSSEAEAKEKVFALEADAIQELTVTADSGETTALEKADGVWRVSEPISVNADAAEASAIASSLASLEVQRVVEDTPSDLEPFGLAEPRVDVAFKVEGETALQHLLIGEKTPTGGDLYTKVGRESRVFLISGFLDRTFNRTTFDLRDKAILKFDRDEVDLVEVAGNAHTVRLAKGDAEWTLTAPWQTRGDYGTVEGLIGRLSTAQMRSIEAAEAADLRPFGLDQPEIKTTIGAGSARATLLIGQEAPDGAVYARDASRPLVFTVDAALVTELKKEPVEYRRKDLFGFRPFNATRLEVSRDGETVVFEKEIASSEDAEDTWRQVEPAAGDLDQTKVEDLLLKISNLRAQSFVESRADTGLDSPAATIRVRFDEGKEERVVVGRSGEDVYAVHGDEAGAARLNARELNEALDALDALE